MLRNLTKLKTNEGFLDRLESKLDEREAEKKQVTVSKDYTKIFTSLVEKFRRPYLVPAIALIILALLILYFVFLKTETPVYFDKIQTEKQEDFQKENEIKKPPVEEKPNGSISEEKKKRKWQTLQNEIKKKILSQIPQIEKEKKIEGDKNQFNNLTGKENKIPSVVPRDPFKEKEIVKADAQIDSNENNSFDEKLNLIDKDGLEKLKKRIFEFSK